jgi:hypothetical protein
MAPVEWHPESEPALWAQVDLDPARWRVGEECRGQSAPQRERSAAGRTLRTGNGHIRDCPDEMMA